MGNKNLSPEQLDQLSQDLKQAHAIAGLLAIVDTDEASEEEIQHSAWAVREMISRSLDVLEAP